MEDRLKSLERQNSDLSEALRAQLARSDRLSAQIQKLEKQLDQPVIQSILRRSRQAGNRVTGGGIRSLVRRVLERVVGRAQRSPTAIAFGRMLLRPWPKTAARLDQFLSSLRSDPTKSSGGELRQRAQTPDEMSVSVRSIYDKLKAALATRDRGDS
jgi:hypothetical protein